MSDKKKKIKESAKQDSHFIDLYKQAFEEFEFI